MLLSFPARGSVHSKQLPSRKEERKKERKIGRNGSTPMSGEEEEVVMMMNI